MLAIAAAKLGWDPVIACDHEQAALDAAAANAAANGVAARAAAPQPAPRATAARAPSVVANLTAPILTAVAERLGELEPAQRPERLVCSGLLAREADGVSARLGAAGLVEAERRSDGDWTALLRGAVEQSAARGIVAAVPIASIYFYDVVVFVHVAAVVLAFGPTFGYAFFQGDRGAPRAAQRPER